MKLHHTQSNIERVGVESEIPFTIKSTAKSFEILSSSLYTDPITAIIRELSSNAYDSHVAAGKQDVPFQIHLPNNLEPFLSFKDYGTGLSDEDVLHLYTTYFESTKTESNDYIGALGLGSKSPFSYSKSYEVISRFNGFLRSYHMFINEHGIPDVAKMMTTKTDEENGLEIKIGIKPEDFSKVINRTSSTLTHFKVLPTVVGALHFEFDKIPESILSTANWKITKSIFHKQYTAVQGQIAYRVNVSQITDDLSPQEYKLLNYVNFIGYFDIGDLEVAANREEIRYDEYTKQKLIQRLRESLRYIIQHIKNTCEKADNKWDAYVKLNLLSVSIFNNRDAISRVIDSSTIQHKILDFYLNHDAFTLPKPLRYHALFSYRYSNQSYTRTKITNDVRPDSSIIFIINDVKSGGIARLTNYMQRIALVEITQAIIINTIKKPISLDFTLDKYPNYKDTTLKLEFEQILSSLGNPKIHKLSELCPPVASTTKTRPINLKVFTYNKLSWSAYNKIVEWEPKECNIKNGGLYFVLKYSRTIHAEHAIDVNKPINWAPSATRENLHHLVRLINIGEGYSKYKYEDLYGVSLSAFNKIKNESNWHDVFTLARKSLTKTKIKKHVITQRKLSNSESVFGIKKLLTHEEYRNKIKKLPTSSHFRTLLMPIIRYMNNMENDEQQFHKFCLDLYPKINTDKPYVDNVAFFNYNDFDRYPMLQLLNHTPDIISEFDKILQYIKLVDGQKT